MRCSLAVLGWSAFLLLPLPTATARNNRGHESVHFERHAPPTSDRFLPGAGPQRATLSPTATVLGAWDFDGTMGCNMQGWTSVDLTDPPTYFHVADASELNGGDYGRLVALRGSQSLWCGVPAGPGFPQCGWAAPPGYGNNWNQAWATKRCVALTAGGAITFTFSEDSEPFYDATHVEVTVCGQNNWVLIDGGSLVFDGIIVDSTHTTTIPPAFDNTSIEIRFRFASDGGVSDEDGLLFDGDGALLLDDLVVTDDTGTLIALEDFEGETGGAQETEDWHAVPPQSPFGDYAALFQGSDVLQEDGCVNNMSCFWAFFDNSPDDYSCGGHPGQLAVPYGAAAVGYFHNEVWSPWIEWTGTGTVAHLEFDVYRDLAPVNEVYYTWRVRSMVDGCPGWWRDRSLTEGSEAALYYGDNKDWYRHIDDFGDLVDPAATHIQIALGAVEVPMFNPSPCHSQAPLIDNVVVSREATSGPRWVVEDIDLFQDTFPRDGSLTGTGRADMAQDPVHGPLNPQYVPGDSAVVQSCTDAVNGIPQVSGAPYEHHAVYCYVSVAPPDTGKAGAHLDNTLLLGGQPRFVSRGMVSAAGMQWTQMNCDRRRNASGLALSDGEFCIDLPDNLFEAGDTIFYFFGAKNTLSEWSYWTREAGTVYTIEEAAAMPLEFQILPGGAYLRGGDILYVDGMDGLGAQPYFDTALQQHGYLELVDRFDVNAPSSAASNRLGTRVYSDAQLVTPYRGIIWNTGDLPITIGDGTKPDKCNDWLVLDAFLSGLEAIEQSGGLYLNGDDLPSAWAAQSGPSAVAMRSWLHYSMPPGGDNHAPRVGTNPYGVGLAVADNAFGDPLAHPLGVDTLIAFGGCPVINDFDYMTPTGAATVQMEYRGVGDGGAASAAAVIGERTPNFGGYVSVMLSGFSFHSIRDDRVTPPELDRSHHMQDVLVWLIVGISSAPVGAGDSPGYANTLAQNYPNPFNPVTTIAFTVKERARVRLRVYDVTGALVRALVDDIRAPGITHTVTWDGRNEAGEAVASGVYFYRLVTKDFTQTKKMVVLK